jgi:hypothetical protein
VSTTPKPPSPDALDAPQQEGKRTNRKIDEAFEEVARLAGSDVAPAAFFQDFLVKSMSGIEAPAGAIWLRTPQGFLQLQCQYNLEQVGLDKHKGGRQSHNELLRQAFQMAKPMLLEPYGTTGIHEGLPAGNPTEYVVLIAPIMMEKEVVGLVEVWQEPRWDARVQRTCLNYLVQMAGYAANYVRNQQGRKLAGQEQLWSQLEAFARDIHASLDPTRVAYQVANEGRRLIACDRVSVATVEAKKCKIEAVSGSDTVEKRSNLILLMRGLVDAVLKWDEKLVYQGTKDDSLPPDVLTALDDYLAESNSKLLVVQPLRDERQKDIPGPARAALVMECFETPDQTEPLISRLEVVGRHATSALYNAVELRRIPLGWIWKPVAKVQEGLGGKVKAIITLVVALLVGIVAALVLVPYPLKMDANGQLVPVERQKIYSPHVGFVRKFLIEPNSSFRPGQILTAMEDAELGAKIVALDKEIESLTQLRRSRAKALTDPKDQSAMRSLEVDQAKTLGQLSAKLAEREDLIRINNCDPKDPRNFFLVAPDFRTQRASQGPRQWTVLDPDFRENFINRQVKSSDPILRLGDVQGPWEVELKIPQKHIGQVRRAFPSDAPSARLEVDLLVTSAPTRTFKGILERGKVAYGAEPNRDDHNESAPVVVAYVTLNDPAIPEDQRVPPELFVNGVEVHAKVRCGNHALGYSLFYGLWEFFYEKVVFFF